MTNLKSKDRLGKRTLKLHPPYGAINLEVPLIHAFDHELRLSLRNSLLFSLSRSLHWGLSSNLRASWRAS